jgi:hypothetical protein
MKAMNDAQQVQLRGAWKVLRAMENPAAEHYAFPVLWALGRALAQLPDSMHSQTRKRHAVFEWAMTAGAELEQLLEAQ